MKYLTIVLFLLIPFAAFPIDFYEDFESYDVGDDPDDSADWNRIDEGGQLLVAELSGNKVVESHFLSQSFIGYKCDAVGEVLDIAIDYVFRYDGSECSFWLAAREQDHPDNELYMALAHIANPTSPCTIKIYFRDSSFTMIELYSVSGPVLDPLTWYNIKFVVEGDNPVTLTVYVDGSQVGQHVDSTYLVSAGETIMGCSYDETAEPDCWLDNFNADEYPLGIESASLGEIKAVYR